MIGVLHAYSRSNAGDGLLVDLARERIARVVSNDILLIALDPASFPEVPHRVGVGTKARGIEAGLPKAVAGAAGVAASAVTGRRVGSVARELADVTAYVAVGGGYLRAVDTMSAVGTLLNHWPQMLTAGRADVPSIYLPQSVGPLRGPAGRAITRSLARMDAVCVRDDWSRDDLAHLTNIHRVPDLAVLDIAEAWDKIDLAGSDGKVGLVARAVSHAPGYENHMLALADRLGDRAMWAVQTAGDPTKSDGVHYQRLNVEAGGSLPDLLDRRQLSMVVSVRLHGALMALRAGVPAIHLAYDRKGPSAFSDLGLGRWCLDVRNIDREQLNSAVDEILADPASYWAEVEPEVANLGRASVELDALMTDVLANVNR